MSCGVLSGTCRVRVDWRRARKVDQFICFVLRVAALGVRTNLVWRVIKTGEWSEDKSELDSAVKACGGIRRATAKSSRSGIFRLSVGQYVGSPVEICVRLSVCMALRSSHPLGVISRDPL